MYVYVCTLCVFVCPLETGRELGMQQDFFRGRLELGTFCLPSECGLFQGQVHISSFNSRF